MTFHDVLSLLLVALGSYLVGAVPFGLVLGRALRGVDIREHGSRNLGATNALRVLGAPIGAAVFALDFAKGLLPSIAAQKYAASAESAAWAGLVAAIAAVLGHVFPVYLRFRGGKGVATGAGVLAALAPVPTALAFGVFAITVAATRFVSLGSILAALALPLACFATSGRAALGERLPATIAAVAVAVLVVLRHRENLARLAAGTEPRVGARARAQAGESPAQDERSRVGP
jgi:glycerol-3-phosphate acyltransferase PlsY